MRVYYVGGVPFVDELYHMHDGGTTFGRMDQNELMHYNIKGSHWGKRRFQNEDGTYTEAGKRRYGIGDPKTGANNSNYRLDVADTGTGNAKAANKAVKALTPSPVQKVANNVKTTVKNSVNGGRAAADKVFNTVKGAANSVGSTISNSANQVGQTVNNVAGNVGNAVGGAARDVADWTKTAAGNVGNAVGGAAGNVGNAVGGAARDVADWISNAAGDVGNFMTGNQARENLNDAQNSFPIGRGGRVEAAQNEYNRTLPGMVSNAANDVADWTKTAAGNVGNAVGGAARDVGNWISNAAGDVKNFVTGDRSRAEAQDAARSYSGDFEQAANSYNRTLPGMIGNAARDVADWTKTAADNVGNAVGGAARDVADWTKTAAGNVGNAVGGATRDVADWTKTAAGNVGNAVGGAARDVGNAATGAFNSAKEWTANAANDVGNAATGAFNSAKEWTGNAANDVGNWVGNAARDVGNIPQNIANWYTGNDMRDAAERAYRDADYKQHVGQTMMEIAANNPYNDENRRLQDFDYGQNQYLEGGKDRRAGDSYMDYYNAAPRQKINDALSNVGNAATGAFNSAKEWTGNAANDVGNFARNAANNVGNAVGGAARDVGTFASNLGGNVSQALANAYNGVATSQQVQQLQSILANPQIPAAAKQTAAQALNAMRNAANGVGGWAGNAANDVGNFARNAANNVGNAVGGAARDVADWTKTAAGNVGNAVGGAANKVGDWGSQQIKEGQKLFKKIFG